MSETPQINENNSDTDGEKKEKKTVSCCLQSNIGLLVCFFDFLAWPF